MCLMSRSLDFSEALGLGEAGFLKHTEMDETLGRFHNYVLSKIGQSLRV